MKTLVWFDQQIFYVINQVLTHPVLDTLFIGLTDFTKTPTFYILLPLILILIFRRFGWRGLGALILAVVFASMADMTSSHFIKELFARHRPQFSQLPFEVILRRPSEGNFSFPSSHALDAFVVASFLFFLKRSWGAFALILASLIAYSRVYVGLHFPSDIFAGALFGITFGIFSAFVTHRLYLYWQEGGYE